MGERPTLAQLTDHIRQFDWDDDGVVAYSTALARSLRDEWPDAGIADVDVEDADKAGIGHSDYVETTACALYRRLRHKPEGAGERGTSE